MTDAGNETQPQAHDVVPLGRVAGYCLAIMSLAAAVIHFAVAAGSGTDPNSGPLLVLLAIAYWPSRSRAYQRGIA
jgi:hypothetical protein